MFVWNSFTNDARVLREATALVEFGYEVKVVAIQDLDCKDLPNKEIMNGFRVIRVKRYRGKKLSILNIFLIMLQMIKEGLDKKYDVYHSHDLSGLIQGYICSRLKRSKLIYDSHEVQTARIGTTGKKIFHYLEKYLIKKVDKVIMTTDMRADYVKNLYNINKPEVVHNYPFYIDINNLQKVDLYKTCNIPLEEPILLYQGGIQKDRGLEQIIEAIPKFKKGIVVFIGAGHLKPKIEQLVKDKKLESRVRFLDKVPVEHLAKYTANAYLGFQVLQNTTFNHYSTISNKLLEYIMCEVPVVASNFPEIKKIIEGGKYGVVIDPHCSQNIATAVNTLLDDVNLVKILKENCKQGKKKYNWSEEKKELYKIYENI